MEKDNIFYLPENIFRDIHFKSNRDPESPDSIYSKSVERARTAFNSVKHIVVQYNCENLFHQLYQQTDIYTERHIYDEYFEEYKEITALGSRGKQSKRPSNIFNHRYTNKKRQKRDVEVLLDILRTDLSYIKKLRIEWTDEPSYDIKNPNFKELLIEHDDELIELLFRKACIAILENHYEGRYKNYKKSVGGRPIVKSRKTLRSFANQLNSIFCEKTDLQKRDVRGAILEIINSTYLGDYYSGENSDIEINRDWLSKNLKKTGSN